MANARKPRQAELPNTRRRYGSGTLPDTPSALRKACARVTTSDSERMLVGCALLLASRIEAMELAAARMLDVLLKRSSVDADVALRTLTMRLDQHRADIDFVSNAVAALETLATATRTADLVELRSRIEALESRPHTDALPHGLRLLSTTSNTCGHGGCDLSAECECSTCGYAFCRRHGTQHVQTRCVASDGTPSGRACSKCGALVPADGPAADDNLCVSCWTWEESWAWEES